MGCIGKVTMPLLSTLAALVIIVHTAEENFEQNYRAMRPRSMDVAPSNHDQAWKAADIEPVISENTRRNQEGWDDENPDQPMRRRRRKRKRRPQLSDNPDEQPVHERYVMQEEIYQEGNIEMPRRRRKKIDNKVPSEPYRPGQWLENDPDKPLRRRGHRRKRPIEESSWPELSEFGGYQYDRPNEPTENNDARTEIEIEIENENVNKGVDVEPELENNKEHEPHFDGKTQTIMVEEATKLENKTIDRSLSEFSLESINTDRSSESPGIKIQRKFEDKTIHTNDVGKTQDGAPLDPVSLKTLLKRSNGKSLSEILQQNNLSLSDLLHGKEKALTILKMRALSETQDLSQIKTHNVVNRPVEIVQTANKNEYDRSSKSIHLEMENSDADSSDCTTTANDNSNNQDSASGSTESIKKEESRNLGIIENTTKEYLRRRFPVGIRRRLRMRPAANNTHKGQLSRDLIALSSMKYRTSRNMNKSREWKEIIPVMQRLSSSTETNVAHGLNTNKTFTNPGFQETTTEEIFETTTDFSSLSINTELIINQDDDTIENQNTAYANIIVETSEPTTTTTDSSELEKEINMEKPQINPILRPLINSSETRRQAYNNRMKRKRLKQKLNRDTEEHEIKDIFGAAHFVSASEFIEQSQTKSTKSDSENNFTTLEDFITTESSGITQSTRMKKKNTRKTTSPVENSLFTTEDTAKYEIEEIFNDSITSARLTKILKERNMTLSELVKHRERGSSQVHLADIFHNASREPNPPEPFLTKSLIEPISRETYPLRALLDANLHDPKTTTIDTNSVQTNNLNIPVIMDFGNNVNENGENTGIISLFNNFSKINHEIQMHNRDIGETVPDQSNENDIFERKSGRESRTLNPEKDLMTWNDLITLMQRNHQRENVDDENVETDNSPTFETLKNIKLEDVDDDGLIVLEDLQNLKTFDSRPTSDELLELKIYENSGTQVPNVSNSSNTTKSVAVATASIIGLGLILFLLTYAGLKWKQQSKIYHSKHAREDECVPTPVFENRKGHRINSSIRSKSPMLSSNIYTIDTIDTHAGNESPEYMWDSLRKPFQ